MKLVGIYRNRGRVLILLAFIPISFVMLCCENFMLWIGQDPKVASYAGIYTIGLIPAMFFHS